MRGILTPSFGVTCVTALALALPALPATAAPARPSEAVAAVRPSGAVAAVRPSEAVAAVRPSEAGVPGSTRSLPLVPLTRERVLGTAPVQGLYRPGGEHFSLVGVVWDDPDTELHGHVQVRTRTARSGKWSDWQDVETHNTDHGADPGTAERASRRVRGATAPLWVGASKGVEVRVAAARGAQGAQGAQGGRTLRPWPPLPAGLHLELVDPGEETGIARLGALEIPALGRRATERELARTQGPLRARPYIGPRPRIVTRRGWGADESLRVGGLVHTKTVKVAFVHHTASGNNYTCAQAPSVIRSIYRYHVDGMGWRDIGYNFLVDKCGTIYEGRAGGVTKAVLGAHTAGFNNDSMGIAVIGSYSATKPSGAAVTAVARLTAWKLGLFGADPHGRTYLTSAGGNLFPKGKNVRLNVISGHRDGFATECPGKWLYAKLGTARSSAARYQGR
ncbi:peptidoglycan recognition protein family protein [Streptomyces puniciscabiei]|uniref:peptidoglycan recognition protein family protein n=1 Tax=Streptomyces puniciscabiei TaxID=164348 RepID=UPI00332959F4